MKNEPHDPNSGWQCATELHGIMWIAKWMVIVFGVLWLIGEIWKLATEK